MFNKVIIVGRLGQDAEVREAGQATLARVSVATTRWDKANSREVTDWVPVTIWNPGKVVSYLTKGTGVAIEGRVIERSWEGQDGSKRKSLEVHSNFVRLLGGPGGGTGTQAKKAEDGLGVTDDDIPF